MKVLLFKTTKKVYDVDWKKYLEANLPEGSTVDINYYNDIEISITGNIPKVSLAGRGLEEYDFVYFKSWHKKRVIAQLIATYLALKGLRYSDKAVSIGVGMNKIQQMLSATSIIGIKIPDSYYFSPETDIHYSDLVSRLGEKFIMKAISASEGKDNYLIDDEGSFNKARSSDSDYVYQEFIENEFDYRFGVIGGKVKYIKKRTRFGDSTHMNNISKGASVEYVDPELLEYKVVSDLAAKAAHLFSIDIAGVDFIISGSEPYLLEVNPSPAYKNDPSMLKHLAEYFEKSAD